MPDTVKKTKKLYINYSLPFPNNDGYMTDQDLADSLIEEFKKMNEENKENADYTNIEPLRYIEGVQGTTKREYPKIESPDYILSLWTMKSMNDPDFLLASVEAEREQMEHRRVKCINIEIQSGAEIMHIKSPNRKVEYLDVLKEKFEDEKRITVLVEKEVPGLASKIQEIMNDKNSHVTERIGNISEGLVWNYFVVYLKTVLKELEEHAKEWEEKEKKKLFSYRFFIIIPKYGQCFDTLAEAMDQDGVCHTEENHINIPKVDDAGMIGRPFTPNVHKITAPNEAGIEEEYYFIGEFANPVNTIYQLENEYNKISREETSDLVYRFTNRLTYILGHKDNKHLHNTYEVITWDKGDEKLNERIVKRMMDRVQKPEETFHPAQ